MKGILALNNFENGNMRNLKNSWFKYLIFLPRIFHFYKNHLPIFLPIFSENASELKQKLTILGAEKGTSRK